MYHISLRIAIKTNSKILSRGRTIIILYMIMCSYKPIYRALLYRGYVQGVPQKGYHRRGICQGYHRRGKIKKKHNFYTKEIGPIKGPILKIMGTCALRG